MKTIYSLVKGMVICEQEDNILVFHFHTKKDKEYMLNKRWWPFGSYIWVTRGMDWHGATPWNQVPFGSLLGQDVWEKQSLNIYKPQVQGVSLSTWGIVRKELCSQLPELPKASRARQNRRG